MMHIMSTLQAVRAVEACKYSVNGVETGKRQYIVVKANLNK